MCNCAMKYQALRKYKLKFWRAKYVGFFRSQNQIKADGDKSQESHSDEATPKILKKVTENWENRWHDAGEKVKKYYHDPRSSTGKVWKVLKDEILYIKCK